jgi:endonuclease/exonuclease/phosphatase family metal-dependent hydrolase
MTCNVHSCAGRDRKISPQRIADVIAHHESDIIALQELDIGLLRTRMIDQARMKFIIEKPVKPE